MSKITKYKHSNSIKYQIVSDYSAFAINGGSEERNENIYKRLEKEAKEIINKNNYQYYIIDRYMSPGYGIMCVNLRVYNSQEDLNKELNSRKKAEIKAEKEYQKYLNNRKIWDIEEAEKEKENKEIINKLYKSLKLDKNKIKVSLPHYNAEYKNYRSDLVVEVSDVEVEKILNDEPVNFSIEYHQNYETYLLGEDFITYKLVNRIINWLNKNSIFKFNKINKNYSFRRPMAYCVLDYSKYPDTSNARIKSVVDRDIYDKLNKYEAVAYDIALVR